MHDFHYRGKDLYCERVRVAEIARRQGTPLYVYSLKTITDHFRKIRTALRGLDPLICFSMKANSSLAVCDALLREGAGLDVVSGGELFKARFLKADPKKVVYASVGKTGREIEEAIRAGILLFNVESIPELRLICRISGQAGRRTNVSLRVNPDIEPRTHRHVATGKQESKFGLDFRTARMLFSKRAQFPNLNMRGLHIHIGSQITEAWPFKEALKKLLVLKRDIETHGARIDYVNIGGGLGIVYRNEKPQTAEKFARAVTPILKQFKARIILEPGRFIAGNAGILVTRVTYVKKTPVKNFIIADAGMNDLMRPSLYEAYHEIVPVRKTADRRPTCPERSRGKTADFDVVGPICESGDYLAENRKMPEPAQGDLLAVMGAGAYGFSMASNYNSRPRAAEVLVSKDRFWLIRRRETYQDLIRGERSPDIML